MIVYFDKGSLEYEDYVFRVCEETSLAETIGYNIVAFGKFNGITKGVPVKSFKTRNQANKKVTEMNRAYRRGDEVFSLTFNHYW